MIYEVEGCGGIYSMNDKCVVLNAKKMNFDGKLDFSILSSDVTVYEDTTEQQLTERIQGAYSNYDDNESEFYNAGTDEDAGMWKS